MNGKRAKKLRRMARAYYQNQFPDKSLGEGYNTYHQVDNRYTLQQAVDPDGKLMFDDDGLALLKPELGPGTIHCGWNLRVLYQKLKKVMHGKRIRS